MVRALYGKSMYIRHMATETKTERWSIRVSPTDDRLVRRALEHSGVSLSEYVVRQTLAAAIDDLADRRLFVLSASAWDELQDILDRPVAPRPRLAALLDQPSVLESE